MASKLKEAEPTTRKFVTVGLRMPSSNRNLMLDLQSRCKERRHVAKVRPWVVFAAIGATIVVVILFVTAKTGQPGFDRDGGN
jgi:hypothetical protein